MPRANQKTNGWWRACPARPFKQIPHHNVSMRRHGNEQVASHCDPAIRVLTHSTRSFARSWIRERSTVGRTSPGPVRVGSAAAEAGPRKREHEGRTVPGSRAWLLSERTPDRYEVPVCGRVRSQVRRVSTPLSITPLRRRFAWNPPTLRAEKLWLCEPATPATRSSRSGTTMEALRSRQNEASTEIRDGGGLGELPPRDCHDERTNRFRT